MAPTLEVRGGSAEMTRKPSTVKGKRQGELCLLNIGFIGTPWSSMIKTLPSSAGVWFDPWSGN